MPFYAVAIGRRTGVFSSWAEAEAETKGFSGAVFKNFKTQSEAKAFVLENSQDESKTSAAMSTKRKVETIDLSSENDSRSAPAITKRKSETIDLTSLDSGREMLPSTSSSGSTSAPKKCLCGLFSKEYTVKTTGVR